MVQHGKSKTGKTVNSGTDGGVSASNLPGTGILQPVSLSDSTVDVQQRAEGITRKLSQALSLYNLGSYVEALQACEEVYEADAFRTDNLLLLGAVHFQMRNFSEAIFYCQQCVRVDPNFAEGYSNLGNALKELGDVKAAVQFYLKAIKLKPRYSDAYNNLAGAYMQLGQMQEAMETYQMALTLNPQLVDAHSNLGNLYKASGDLTAAKRCYMEAVRVKPEFAIAWSNLAGVFKDEGQSQAAISYYKEAIRLVPEFADAHSNLGNTYKDQRMLAEAMECYKTAIALRGDFAIAHGNLGICLWETGDVEAAIRELKYAIQLEPNYPDAYNNLGNVLRHQSKAEEAVQCFRSALRLKPDHPHAYNNLGNAMKDMGMIKEAIHCYVTAIRLLPTYAAAHSNLGNVLKEQGKLPQAISHYQEAITIDPLFADAYSNLGNCYKETGHAEEAVKCYQTALKIKPDYPDALANLAALLKDNGELEAAVTHYKSALALQPDHAEAFANLVHTQVQICDWEDREGQFAKLAQLTEMQLLKNEVGAVPSVQPFHMLAYPMSLAELLHVATKYSARCKSNVALVETHFTFRPKPKSVRLRIGYVSSDFGNHPLSHLTQSVFGSHDLSRFEVFCYALSGPDGSAWRRRIESEAEHFKDISQLHAGEGAQLIHNDGIHILINLNGYTKGARNEIFALHPAPIQMSWLGFAGTMGADYIEYVIADDIVIPDEYRGYYSEKILKMPHTYMVTDHRQTSKHILTAHAAAKSALMGGNSGEQNADSLPPAQPMLDVPTRARYGISEDKFVYACFNQLYKVDPDVFTAWCNVLKRTKNSIMWLLRFPPAAEANLLKEADKRGVKADQFVFSDVCPRDEHLLRGYLIDLCLDTPAYNGHTTAADMLWTGTPMITIRQDKMVSRVATGLLSGLGIGELSVDNLLDYEELAVTLATDQERLFSYRKHIELAREDCATFDTQRFVINLEKGFLGVWNNYESGDPLEDVKVVDDSAVYTLADAGVF